ncbi:hypothetical protein GUITHDRAFT_145568 [Guillardia theta CCMP2712]|uniref:Uncharacterized protein n=1 Tax=Guillardia theta (strain CCMP2712) TaxID=905079 RepID=L1IKF2_GUITC|nr:hypothetical protein GUITHDRAFT_145568 [Guillardia theta CCMP2712]EKX36721.1 hypothetical protein GUITHDRAFT_145568 [Guillardia theta CCMP2712]|eukprot:XP_005823701.1 hypothetical protein GUITHDRAFT_145568 [Guillardia theta CCMP2712]
MSVIDTIRHITNKNNQNSAKILQNILLNYPDIQSKILDFKFRGRGQRDIPVADFDTIQMILQHLPERSVQNDREEIIKILKSFCNEHYPQAQGVAAMEQSAQATSSNLQRNNDIDPRLLELEIENRKLDIEERRLKIQNQSSRDEFQLSRDKFELFKDELEFFKEAMKVNGVLPPSIANSLQDYTFNKFLHKRQKLMSNNGIASDQTPTPHTELQTDMFETIGLQDKVLESKKTKFTPEMLKRAGKILADLYRTKYGHDPEKEQRRCDGKLFSVNVYQKKDSDLMQMAIEQTEKEFKAKPEMFQTHITRFTQ